MQTFKEKKCKHCTKPFTPKQALQNCCSYDCFQAHQSKRHEERFERAKMKREVRGEVMELQDLEVVRVPGEGIKATGVFGFKPRKPIASRSKTNKNTARTLTQETIETVYARDGYVCICCGSRNLDLPHHAFYGAQANHGPDRNEPKELVTVCTNCHYDIHSKGMQGKREFCIDHLKKIYGER